MECVVYHGSLDDDFFKDFQNAIDTFGPDRSEVAMSRVASTENVSTSSRSDFSLSKSVSDSQSGQFSDSSADSSSTSCSEVDP